jgi:hypothetical protein
MADTKDNARRYIQQFYDSKGVQVENTTELLGLYVIDNGVYIDGEINGVKKVSDSVIIDGLEGRLKLDKNKEFVIKSTKGNVVGDVANGGTIKTSTGDIGITIRAPLEVIIDAPNGDCVVFGMKTEEESKWIPEGEKPIGVLYLTSEKGGVYVTYKKQ